jgi:hypothetical protein
VILKRCLNSQEVRFEEVELHANPHLGNVVSGVFALLFAMFAFSLQTVMGMWLLSAIALAGLVVLFGLLALLAGVCTIAAAIRGAGHEKPSLLLWDGIIICVAGAAIILAPRLDLIWLVYGCCPIRHAGSASGIGMSIGWKEPPHRFHEVLRDGKLRFANCSCILAAANDSDITVPVEKPQLSTYQTPESTLSSSSIDSTHLTKLTTPSFAERSCGSVV